MKKVLNFISPFFLTLMVFLITLVLFYIVFDIFSLNTNIIDIRDVNNIYAGAIVALFTTLVVWFLYKIVHRTKISQMGLNFNKHAVIITIISSFMMTVGFYLFIMYSNKTQLTEWAPHIDPIHIIYVLLLYATVGVNEEILFRGYLFKFYKNYNRGFAYLISFVFFILIHFMQREFSISYLSGLITATLLLTVIYDLSQSIWPSIILHMLVDIYLSFTSIGSNSGSLIYMNNYSKYDAFKTMHAYGEAIINTVTLMIVLLYYYLVQKNNKHQLTE